MAEARRYHSVSIVLHWTMLLGFVFMLASGLYMVNADIPKADQFKLYQVHKAAGVLMLWAVLLRLLTRFLSTAPQLPIEIPARERSLAKIGHIALYMGLLAIPLSGWLMVSASPFGLPTFVFVDWIKWPHIPGVARNKEIEALAKSAHWYLVITMLVLLVSHIGAVIWHKKKQGLNLINRMWWRKHE